MNAKDLIEVRDYGMRAHSDWKLRSRTSDLIVQNKFSTLWADETVTKTAATVENVYLEALEDKVASAGLILPFVLTPPTRGTREDRAERVAQKRRRAFISGLRDSNIQDKHRAWLFDWFAHGAQYAIPWIDWHTDKPWYPYLVRLDPRFAYPIAHDSNDHLSQIFFLKYRRLVELEREYGVDHPTLQGLRSHFGAKSKPVPDTVEELWWFDTQRWGVAVMTDVNRQDPFYRYVDPTTMSTGAPYVEWLVELHPHQMDRCPVVEKGRRTSDGEYRSPLEAMIPNLQIAHSLMTRMLHDVDFQIFAPRGVQGVENPEDYGPGAIMIGDGSGQMRFDSAREPMNFEAMQKAQEQIESARNMGAFPRQRSGDFGASIASAKGVTSVQGSYNSQQAWAQSDIALFYREALSRWAEIDEKWAGGVEKEMTGFDEGEMYTDKYDPATLWKGDYRVEVGFHNMGMDESSHLLKLATARNLGGMALRTYMRKSGLVENPLAEEREMSLEAVHSGFLGFMMKQADQGNLEPLRRFAELVDGDAETARSAALQVIKETFGAVPAAGQAAGGMGDPGKALSQIRSLEQGGIPGNAAEMPNVSQGLLGLLPSGQATATAETLPGR